MQYTHLGRTGLEVSRLCLGTMNFGPLHRPRRTASPSWTRRWKRASTSSTPPTSTAGQTGEGLTEEIIGRWFAQGGGRREKVVLATKVYGRMGDWPNDGGLSAFHIGSACEDSLRACRPTTSTSTRCTTSTATRRGRRSGRRWSSSCREGKVLYVGSSNFAGWHIAEARRSARPPLPGPGLASRASTTSTSARSNWRSIPACEEYGLGVIPWSPLAGGMLGGVLEKTEHGRRADREGPAAHRREAASNWRPTRRSARNWARSRPTWRWPGCCTSPR